MRRRGLAAAAMAVMAVGLVPLAAGASSHREAPLIAQDPEADNTDLYAFVSPDNTSTVTFVANFVPFEQPAGGPNFYRFGDDVLYQIHVDNRGDARDHVTFSFRFHTDTVDPNTFLYNTGPITWDATHRTYTNWNRPQRYTVTMTRNGTTTTLGTNLLTPPSVVGARSTGTAQQYHTLAMQAVHHVNGATVFAGQRDDPFYADLGGIFDLLNIAQPFGAPGQDYLAGINVQSIVLQVPKTWLRGPNDGVIGVWSTTSRQSTTVLHSDGSKTASGPWVQVSRLGNPLVNEVVIPLGQKDHFNASKPIDDPQFLSYVTTPELAHLLNVVFNAGAPETNRNDLVAVFLTGVQGLNMPAHLTHPGEELRLNMDIAPSSSDPNNVNRLGVLGGQNDGFPNGRRLADDVTDIAIQAVDGVLVRPAGQVPPQVGDGVNHNDVPFLQHFPYVADPHQP